MVIADNIGMLTITILIVNKAGAVPGGRLCGRRGCVEKYAAVA